MCRSSGARDWYIRPCPPALRSALTPAQEAIEKSTCEMEVPVVEHKEYELVSVFLLSYLCLARLNSGQITVENGFLKLMTKDGTIRDDVMLPDFGELGKEIQQASDEGKTMLITVQSTADEEAVCVFVPFCWLALIPCL